MKLCVQTALSDISIALINDDQVLAHRAWQSNRDEANKLLPEILAMLQEAGVEKTELTGLVGITGPGSFTALRVGLSVLNAMAYILEIPMEGYSTFDYLRAQCQEPVEAICMSSGANECFIQTKEETGLVTLEEVPSHLQGTWTGTLIPLHQKLQTEGSWQQPTKSVPETWTTLLQQPPTEATTILVPTYLKGANITTRKTR